MAPLEKRRQVVGRLVSLVVQVVGHHVEEIQESAQFGHVVAILDPEPGRRDGGGQQPTLLGEHFGQRLGQQDEILLVGGFASDVLGARELPEKVETVEAVRLEEVAHRADELTPAGSAAGHFGVASGRFHPTAERNHHLEARVGLLEAHHSLVTT